MEQLGVLGLQAIASDLDWEVKLKSSILWTNIFHRFNKESGNINKDQLISQNVNNDQLIAQLEKIGAFSALLFGCKDYEEPVREAYCKLTESVILELDLDEHTLNKLRKVVINFYLDYFRKTLILFHFPSFYSSLTLIKYTIFSLILEMKGIRSLLKQS